MRGGRVIVLVVVLLAAIGVVGSFVLQSSTPSKTKVCSGRRVAVLLHGRKRSLALTGNSILSNVVKRLDADVFAGMPLDKGDEDVLFLLAKMFGDHLTRASITPQPNKTAMEAALRGSAEFPRLQELHGGALWLQPVGGPAGTLWLYFWQHVVYGLMLLEEAACGKRYDWVVAVRPDAFFETPLPELALLQQMDPRGQGIWTQQEEAFGGANDRFAIMPRALAEAYYGRWAALTEGSMGAALLELPKTQLHNSETFLYHIVRTKGQGVWHSMAPVFYVVCPTDIDKDCTAEHPCYEYSANECRKNWKQRAKFSLAPNGEPLVPKYLSEYERVKQFAQKVWLRRDRRWSKEFLKL